MEREALAVFFSVEHFRPYIEGGPQFKVITDHSSLKWFFNLPNPTGRLACWGCRVSPYDFVIEHRMDKDNVVPDALSRAVPLLSIDPLESDPWYNKLVSKCNKFPNSCSNYNIIIGKLCKYSKSKFGFTSDFDWKEAVPSYRRS